MTLVLRPADQTDLDLYFALQQDDEAVWMAAFTSANLADRELFDARWDRILSDHSIVVRTVVVDGADVGNVMHFVVDGKIEVAYWIAREHWGKGYASEALRLLLADIVERPVFARVAQDNVGSLAVLRRNGFTITGHDEAPAAGRGEMVKEHLLTLVQ